MAYLVDKTNKVLHFAPHHIFPLFVCTSMRCVRHDIYTLTRSTVKYMCSLGLYHILFSLLLSFSLHLIAFFACHMSVNLNRAIQKRKNLFQDILMFFFVQIPNSSIFKPYTLTCNIKKKVFHQTDKNDSSERKAFLFSTYAMLGVKT